MGVDKDAMRVLGSIAMWTVDNRVLVEAGHRFCAPRRSLPWRGNMQ